MREMLTESDLVELIVYIKDLEKTLTNVLEAGAKGTLQVKTDEDTFRYKTKDTWKIIKKVKEK